MKSSRLTFCARVGWAFFWDPRSDYTHFHYMHRDHTSEVSNHLFIQAVELLPVLESGAVRHSPVTGTGNHGGHHRGRWGSRAKRQKHASRMHRMSGGTLGLCASKRQGKINQLMVQKRFQISKCIILCILPARSKVQQWWGLVHTSRGSRRESQWRGVGGCRERQAWKYKAHA